MRRSHHVDRSGERRVIIFAVAMQPTRLQARLILVCLICFWTLGTILNQQEPLKGAVALLVVPAMASGFGFYRTVFSIAAAESGRPARQYMGWRAPFSLDRDERRELRRESVQVCRKILDPGWYGRVIKASEINRVVATAALLLALLSIPVGLLV